MIYHDNFSVDSMKKSNIVKDNLDHCGCSRNFVESKLSNVRIRFETFVECAKQTRNKLFEERRFGRAIVDHVNRNAAPSFIKIERVLPGNCKLYSAVSSARVTTLSLFVSRACNYLRYGRHTIGFSPFLRVYARIVRRVRQDERIRVIIARYKSPACFKISNSTGRYVYVCRKRRVDDRSPANNTISSG